MISLAYPDSKAVHQFLEHEAQQDYSYPEVGASRGPGPVTYDNDHSFIVLGAGAEVWEKAQEALCQWQQFPPSWTRVYPADSPLRVGENVAVLFRLFGIWWTNSARIVYCLEEENRFGFAYGTLPGHVEMGEECFWIERDAAGKITYQIRAFSRPRFWLARLAYPLARAYQRRFVRQSMARMQAIVSIK